MTRPQITTVSSISTLPVPERGQVDYPDSQVRGLYLRVGKTAKTFVLVFRPKQGERAGKVVRHTIGRFGDKGQGIGLADARAEANRIKGEGKLPDTAPAVLNESDAFGSYLDQYIRVYQKAKRGNRTADALKKMLERHCKPIAGTPLKAVTKNDVLAILDGLMEAEKPYLANRVYSGLATFFKWAAGRDYVAYNPMSGLERPFDQEEARARRSGKGELVYTDDEMKKIWQAADGMERDGGAIKLMALTGKRRSEVFGMRWEELDLEAGVWRLPAERNKTGSVHAMPLSKLAVRVLKAQPKLQGCPYVFWTRGGGNSHNWQRIADKVREDAGVDDFVFHGLRHTLITRLHEMQVPPHVVRAVASHSQGSDAHANYAHYDYAAEQREALEAWADRLQQIVQGEGVAVLR